MTIFAEALLEDWEGKLKKCTNEEYHERPELSSSDIKHALESPAHFKRLVLEKDSLPEKPRSEAFDLGSSAHECFLEQTTEHFVALPKLDRRTKAGKEAYEKFLIDNAGKRIITDDQYERLKRMFDVIAGNSIASQLISGEFTMIEESFLYRDTETGLRCKFRPDVMSLSSQVRIPKLNLEIGEPYIVDYKTAESASPHAFAKACARYYYHLSAAHYLAGVERLWGPSKVGRYFFIVQETSEPYAVAIYEMSSSDITRAMKLRSRVMRSIEECFRHDSWPDWSDRVRILNIPGYAFNFRDEEP